MFRPALHQPLRAIPLGIDLSRYPLTEQQGEYILALSRLHPVKGIDILVEAFSRSAGNHECDLVIVGDGPQRLYLERQVKDLNLEGRVHFMGAKPHREVPALIAHCKFLVMPSRREAFGNAALEAMAGAKPVIAARVGGIPELVQHGINGLLVRPEDPEALSNAISRLLEDTRLCEQMGTKGRELVEQHYRLEAVAKRHLQVYSEVLCLRYASGEREPEQ